MWMVYKEDENYIQGTFVSKHSTEKAAMNKAKKEINFSHATKDKRTEETLIWLDKEEKEEIRARNGFDRVRTRKSASR